METSDDGIVATGSDHSVGTGITELASLIHDKDVEGQWTVKIVDLPPGIAAGEIEDIFLLLNYEYKP